MPVARPNQPHRVTRSAAQHAPSGPPCTAPTKPAPADSDLEISSPRPEALDNAPIGLPTEQVSQDLTSLRCEIQDTLTLEPHLVERWQQLRAANPNLFSPSFSPEYFQAIDRVRPGGKTAVIWQGTDVVGFLPIEIQRGSLFPPGRLINDAHGPIHDGTLTLDWQWLLRQLPGRNYRFHALMEPPQAPQDPAVFGKTNSFLCDLRQPAEGYRDWLKKTHRTIAKQQQKTNKLGREVGPLRFELASSDASMLDHVMHLKSLQYRSTYIFDIFSVDWIRRLMHDLLHADGALRGQLSLLWAGDELVAGHYGMREADVLHYWFPVYDRRFEFGSPGTALFLSLLDHCESAGIERIDFGYGEMAYKWKLCNVVSQVSYGAFCSSAVERDRLRYGLALRKMIRRMPSKERLKQVVRGVYPQFGGTEYGQ